MTALFGTVSLTILGLCSLAVYSQKTDYCNPNLCRTNKPHIGCHNDGKFHKACPEGARLVALTKANQETILKHHNLMRQKWNNGAGVAGFCGCRMPTMVWDAELAALAALNVRQCEMKHDVCRNTDTYKFSGQNIYWRESSEPLDDAVFSSVSSVAVERWASESKQMKLEYFKAYPKNYKGPAIGHFTLLVNERNTAVGCALAVYEQDNLTTYLLTCNYATNNVVNWPVITNCTEAGSKCKSGISDKYPKLCTVAEKINPNSEHQ